MCRLSIIIPAYNVEGFIGKTIDSILSQSFTDFECIIVDDGSSDSTMDIVRKYTDSRIKLIKGVRSGGPSKPRNTGIASAKGDYIFIFDSDDIMLPNKLSSYMMLFESYPDADFVFSNFSLIDENGKVIRESFLDDYQEFRALLTRKSDSFFSLRREGLLEALIRANFIGASSIAFKKSFASNAPIFDESIVDGSEDNLASSILSQVANFYFIDEILHQYRTRSGNMSNIKTDRFLKSKLAVLDMLNKLSSSESVNAAVKYKKNEYYYYLGFLYSSQNNFALSRATYSKVTGAKQLPKKFWRILKTYLKQTVHFLKNGIFQSSH